MDHEIISHIQPLHDGIPDVQGADNVLVPDQSYDTSLGLGITPENIGHTSILPVDLQANLHPELQLPDAASHHELPNAFVQDQSDYTKPEVIDISLGDSCSTS